MNGFSNWPIPTPQPEKQMMGKHSHIAPANSCSSVDGVLLRGVCGRCTRNTNENELVECMLYCLVEIFEQFNTEYVIHT